MLKKMLYCLLITAFSFVLVGCEQTYHVNSAPPLRTQCINIKRQQVFVRTHAQNPDHWKASADRRALDREYNRMGCPDVMKESKGRPQNNR